MKKNKESGIRFLLGTFDEKKQKRHHNTTLYKKSQVPLRGSLIHRKYGHIWMKVVINNCENEVVAKTMKELKFTLACFIEQPLVDYFMEVK